MLKIVFSIGMIALFFTTGTLNAQSEPTFEIQTSNDYYYLEFDHPSLDTPITFGEDLDIIRFKASNVTVHECDDYVGVYGSFAINYDDRQPIRQGFVLMFTRDGTVFLDEVYGGTGDYIIPVVQTLKDSFMVMKNYSEMGNSNSDSGGFSTNFAHNVFYFYTEEGLLKEFKTTQEFRNSFILREGVLYLRAHFGSTPFSIHDSSGFIEEGDLSYTLSKSTYYEAVNIDTLGEFNINDYAYFNFTTIDYPGHYTVTTASDIKQFTIEAIVEGIEDGKVYHDSRRIDVSKGQLFLNDQAFLNGGLVDEMGHYSLVVTGINDYEKTLNFTIEDTIEGIKEGSLYKAAPTITFNGRGYLNNQLISSGFKVEENGEYTFVTEGNGDYQRTIDFEVAIEETEAGFLTMEMGIVFSALFVGSIAIYAVYKKR